MLRHIPSVAHAPDTETNGSAIDLYENTLVKVRHHLQGFNDIAKLRTMWTKQDGNDASRTAPVLHAQAGRGNIHTGKRAVRVPEDTKPIDKGDNRKADNLEISGALLIPIVLIRRSAIVLNLQLGANWVGVARRNDLAVDQHTADLVVLVLSGPDDCRLLVFLEGRGILPSACSS